MSNTEVPTIKCPYRFNDTRKSAYIMVDNNNSTTDIYFVYLWCFVL